MYKSLFSLYKRSEIHSHELTYLFWECTKRCNLECKHCGSDCSKTSEHEDMPMQDFLTAIDTIPLKKRDCMVVVSGGEPLLRNDLEEFGYEVRKRGMRWSLVTNGHLYTKERHNSLLNAGLGALTISLDGMSLSHNWLRNNNSSFNLVVKAIESAVTSPRLFFDVVTCVNPNNIGDLPQIYELLKEKGVANWRLFTISPKGRAEHDSSLLLNSEQLKLVMEFIIEVRRKSEMNLNFSCEGFVGEYERRVRDTHFFCRAGINIGSILIDGSIGACLHIDKEFVQGNIYFDNFYDIWENKFQVFRDRSWTKVGDCKNCNSYNECGGGGMHNWHASKENILQCHSKKLKNK